MAKSHVGDLHSHGRAIDPHDLVAPVELVGLPRIEAQRHEGRRLLVAAVREIRYDSSRLVPYWNAGIEKGTDGAPKRMEKSVVDAVKAAVRRVR
jgi:hypothetical protein